MTLPKKPDIDALDFNRDRELPFDLRIMDFQVAMQDVYDFFYDVNELLLNRGLRRLDDLMRPAAMSGFISDFLTTSLANHSRTLTENRFRNGHPDLVLAGVYPNDSVQSGAKGVEIKTTRKKGGAVDMHGARDQWICVFVYEVDAVTEPARERRPMVFTESTSAGSKPETSEGTLAASSERARPPCIARESRNSGGTGFAEAEARLGSLATTRWLDVDDSVSTLEQPRTRGRSTGSPSQRRCSDIQLLRPQRGWNRCRKTGQARRPCPAAARP